MFPRLCLGVVRSAQLSSQMPPHCQPVIYLPPPVFGPKFYPRYIASKITSSPAIKKPVEVAKMEPVQPKPWATVMMVRAVGASHTYQVCTRAMGQTYERMVAIKWHELTKNDVVDAFKNFDYKKAALTMLSVVVEMLKRMAALLQRIPEGYAIFVKSREYEILERILKFTWKTAQFLWKRSNEIRTVVMASPQYHMAKENFHKLMTAAGVLLMQLYGAMVSKLYK